MIAGASAASTTSSFLPSTPPSTANAPTSDLTVPLCASRPQAAATPQSLYPDPTRRGLSVSTRPTL
jgi:hypothetical protein